MTETDPQTYLAARRNRARAALAAAKPLIGMKTRLSRKITVDIPVKFELQ